MNNTNTFHQRRHSLSLNYPQTLFVIPSGKAKVRSHSVKHRYKAPSDFFYLTGLTIENSILIITKEKSYLFTDRQMNDRWGEVLELDKSMTPLIRDLTVEGLSGFEACFRELVKGYTQVGLPLGTDLKLTQTITEFLSYEKLIHGRKGHDLSLIDSRRMVGSSRLVKDPGELDLLTEAAHRTAEAHRLLMQQNSVNKSERQLANFIEAQFLLQDMQWTAYETIVGSGNRSTTLHARASDKKIDSTDLILVDAGGEFGGYCADITRVFPAGKKFSAPQKEIYQIVLEAQKKAIALVQPGTTLSEIHGVAQQTLTEGLIALCGKQRITPEIIQSLMPHSTSHWIGLDVHDPCPHADENGSDVPLKKGMTFTIEPGLYFHDKENFPEFFGIGVRIEDNVIVGETGAIVTTQAAPKELADIEALRASTWTRIGL